MEKRIGILDFGYFDPDKNNSVELINFTFEFVKYLEENNFSRYWMSEHYNDFCSWTNPEVLLTVLAGVTERINIGAAGILIYFHSPYRTALAFKMIATLFPDRIDLGLARGDVLPHMINHLVGTNELPAKAFKENETKLLGYLFDHQLYDSKNRMVPMPPYGGGLPSPWTLGTSLNSALNSLRLNTNFSLSLFHEKRTLSEYKDIWLRYLEDKNKRQANHLSGNIAVQYTAVSDLKVLRMFAAENKVTYNDGESLKIIGEPSFCEDQLNRYFELFGADEIIVHDLSRNFGQRMETTKSLSKFTSKTAP